MASKAVQIDTLINGIHDDNGQPVSGGSVEFQAAGTSTPLDTWADRDKNSLNSNPLTLDIYGRGVAFADGLYKMIIRDAAGVVLYTMDGLEYVTYTNSDLSVGSIIIDSKLKLDDNDITSVEVNGTIDIIPTGTGVVRVGPASGDAKIQTGAAGVANQDLDIAPSGTGKIFFNKGDSGSVGVNIIIDEDTMVSDRDDAIPTQQSVKAYVDTRISTTVSSTFNSQSGFVPSGGNEFKVSIQSPAAMAVDINASGKTWFNYTLNKTYTPSSNPTLTITAADGSNPRWDLVQINVNTQIINVKAGTAAAVPVLPSPDTDFEGIAYVYVSAAATTIAHQSYIYNAAMPSRVRNGDAHFKTNFSIDQKEDTEDSEYQTQQFFQSVSFGTIFDSIVQDKTFLHTVDTFGVRADCDEITYSGSWANNDNSSTRFGRGKTTSSAGSSATLSFFGVSVGVSLLSDTNRGPFSAELSIDGGVTYINKITLSSDNSSGAVYNNFFDLYAGLPIGEYKVKITNLTASTLYLDHFYYTTYVIQRPASIFACKSGSGGTAASISEVPPGTSLLTGTWGTKNDLYTESWNSVQSWTATNGDYVEFKFYGSKIWLHIMQDTGSDIDLDFLIDGANTYVRNTGGFNPDTPGVETSFFYRVDNGSLAEGWHTVRATRTTGAAGTDRFYFGGWAFYSANAPSTICRSLIMGKNSYAVGVDDVGFSYSGTWVGLADDTTAFLRRRNVTVTNGSYVSFTTPNNANLKAIYLVCKIDNSTIGAEVKITLAGAKTRYIDTQTNDYELGAFIVPIYDSFADGILHNQELRVIHNDTTTTTEFKFEGLIFEIGDPVETGYTMVMPKWTRYNQSGIGPDPTVSNTYRLDVYGSKSDLSPGRRPEIHSGWMFAALNAVLYPRIGVMASAVQSCQFIANSTPRNGLDTLNATGNTGYIAGISFNYYPGLARKEAGSSASGSWQKVVIGLKEVV